MSRISRLSIFLVLMCIIASTMACVRNASTEPGTLEVLRAGTLQRPAAEVENVVFVGVRDPKSRMSDLDATLGRYLRAGGFTVTDTPSRAGYIMQITIASAGEVAPQAIENIVNAGYGGNAAFSGTGGTGLVADVLLVQRRVPTARRASKADLKSISSRNALSGTQMRLGLLLRQNINIKDGLPPYFTDALARELESTIHAADKGALAPASEPTATSALNAAPAAPAALSTTEKSATKKSTNKKSATKKSAGTKKPNPAEEPRTKTR